VLKVLAADGKTLIEKGAPASRRGKKKVVPSVAADREVADSAARRSTGWSLLLIR